MHVSAMSNYVIMKLPESILACSEGMQLPWTAFLPTDITDTNYRQCELLL